MNDGLIIALTLAVCPSFVIFSVGVVVNGAWLPIVGLCVLCFWLVVVVWLLKNNDVLTPTS